MSGENVDSLLRQEGNHRPGWTRKLKEREQTTAVVLQSLNKISADASQDEPADGEQTEAPREAFKDALEAAERVKLHYQREDVSR